MKQLVTRSRCRDEGDRTMTGTVLLRQQLAGVAGAVLRYIDQGGSGPQAKDKGRQGAVSGTSLQVLGN